MMQVPKREVELDMAVDYAVQLLVEEAHLVGWQREEFLTSVMDAADVRLAAIAEDEELEAILEEEPAEAGSEAAGPSAA